MLSQRSPKVKCEPEDTKCVSGAGLEVYAVIPRLHQVNQPRFLSLTCYFSQLAGPPEPQQPAGELDGRGGCSRGPWPPAASRPRVPGPSAPKPLLHVFSASAAGACSQHAVRFVPRSPGAQLHFLHSPPLPGPLLRAYRPCHRFCFFAFPLSISVLVCFLTLLR